MKERKQWFKLDNAVKIYPPTQTSERSAMFRMSVTLTQPIDRKVLAEAQDNTLKRFPYFASRLCHGFFWYYFEKNEGAPPIEEDIYNPMQKLHIKRNRRFLYRLLCFKDCIAIEYFHALTDGTGGMTFLMSLVAEYLRLKYGAGVVPSRFIRPCSGEPRPGEYEDSFLTYAAKQTISRNENTAYRSGGTAVPLNMLLIVTGRVPTEQLRAAANKYEASIGIFLTALLLQAAYRKQQNERSPGRRRALPVGVVRPARLLSEASGAALRRLRYSGRCALSAYYPLRRRRRQLIPAPCAADMRLIRRYCYHNYLDPAAGKSRQGG